MKVYLIVGAPAPYDAMVRRDADGNDCIVFDLVRIHAYTQDAAALRGIIHSLVTHEMAHMLLHERHLPPPENAPLADCLKYLCFDEGIAHLLSFLRELVEADWRSAEMNDRCTAALEALRYELASDEVDRQDTLERADSGPFWQKYGAISGMFAVADALMENGTRWASSLMQSGPDALASFMQSRYELRFGA